MPSCRVCGRALDDCGTCVCAGAREPEPPCTCKWCQRQFTFIAGFTPSREVCYFCGPLDVRRSAERLAEGR